MLEWEQATGGAIVSTQQRLFFRVFWRVIGSTVPWGEWRVKLTWELIRARFWKGGNVFEVEGRDDLCAPGAEFIKQHVPVNPQAMKQFAAYHGRWAELPK